MNYWKSSLFMTTLSLLAGFGAEMLLPMKAISSGFTECRSISRNDNTGRSKKAFRSAKLENDGHGYVLNFNTGGRVKIRSNLTVIGSYYTDEPSIDSKIVIQPNGKFEYDHFSTSRRICTVKGSLTFGRGVKQKLFRKE
jgi:hypothetical protein